MDYTNYEADRSSKTVNIGSHIPNVIVQFGKSKAFYRVANNKTQQGLWYDFEGNFTGNIHNKFKFCKNNKLPMPYDESIKGWLSATDTLDDLYNWFTKEDIIKLSDSGYSVVIYEATEYRYYNGH